MFKAFNYLIHEICANSVPFSLFKVTLRASKSLSFQILPTSDESRVSVPCQEFLSSSKGSGILMALL